VGSARKAFKEIIATGKRDCLEDLTRAAEYNTGILRPERATRGPGGWQIPIYTGSGRNPGGEYFERNRAPFLISGEYRPVTVTDIFSGGRFGFEAAMLHLTQAVMHQQGYGKEGMKPWGTAFVPEADRMISAYVGTGATHARPLSAQLDLLPGVLASAIYQMAHGLPYRQGRDYENDSDGFLAVDSGHGLGINGGAWYRTWNSRYGSVMPWDNDNHGNICFNWGTGAWFHNEIIRKSGPFKIATNGALSDWPFEATPQLGNHNVKLEILEVHDVANDIDTVTEADFSVYVKIMDKNWTTHCPNNTRTPKNVGTYSLGNLPTSVIPIRISVIERDNPPTDPNDFCTVGMAPGKDIHYMFFDTRTGRIVGRDFGVAHAGEIVTVQGYDSYNRVRLKFRVTGG
jgi:hypothetical protein